MVSVVEMQVDWLVADLAYHVWLESERLRHLGQLSEVRIEYTDVLIRSPIRPLDITRSSLLLYLLGNVGWTQRPRLKYLVSRQRRLQVRRQRLRGVSKIYNQRQHYATGL